MLITNTNKATAKLFALQRNFVHNFRVESSYADELKEWVENQLHNFNEVFKYENGKDREMTIYHLSLFLLGAESSFDKLLES